MKFNLLAIFVSQFRVCHLKSICLMMSTGYNFPTCPTLPAYCRWLYKNRGTLRDRDAACKGTTDPPTNYCCGEEESFTRSPHMSAIARLALLGSWLHSSLMNHYLHFYSSVISAVAQHHFCLYVLIHRCRLKMEDSTTQMHAQGLYS